MMDIDEAIKSVEENNRRDSPRIISHAFFDIIKDDDNFLWNGNDHGLVGSWMGYPVVAQPNITPKVQIIGADFSTK